MRLFLFLLFVTFFLHNYNVVSSAKENKLSKKYSSNSLIAYAPIHIDEDSDFTAFPGSGTEEDPYIIENYNITSDVEVCGINISATTKFFIIRNCFIDALDFGIWISWLSEGTAQVINNTCVNHYSTGIDLWDVPGAFISNNKLHYNKDGIYCVTSDNIHLESNNCTNNQLRGVSVRFCDNTIIQNNYCSDNEIGIETYFSRNFNVTSNQVILNTKGIYIFNVLSATVSGNIISKNIGNGIIIEESELVGLKTNTISENKYGILMNYSDECFIFNNTITKQIGSGILIHLSDYNLFTYNNLINNTAYGIYLNYSSENHVHHNNFIGNNEGGVSQAYQKSGANNIWFDEESNEGNFWNDLHGSEVYMIEGSLGLYDKYPLSEPTKPPESKRNYLILIITISLALFSIFTFYLLTYIIIPKFRKGIKSIETKKILDYVTEKRKIAYSDDVGVGLFRFGVEGGELVKADFRNLDVNLDVLIGFSYVSIGQGQRYEVGVYGPLPAPSLEKHNVIIFSSWGKDDEPSDPRLKGEQYYLITVIFPEENTKHLVRVDTMNQKFRNYIKKFKYPNRMTKDELNHFREIVFV